MEPVVCNHMSRNTVPPNAQHLRVEGKCENTLDKTTRIHEGVFSCQLLLYNVSMNILQQIFSDHYEEIKYTLTSDISIFF